MTAGLAIGWAGVGWTVTAQEAFQAGSAALTVGDASQAEQAFREALRLNPALPAAWRGLGIALGRQGQWAAAAEAQAQATTLQPTHAAGWVMRGWAVHKTGQHGEAIRFLQRAAHLDPQNLEAYNALGVVYLFADRPRPAEASTRQALKLDPQNGTAYYNLGLSLDRQGRYAEAVAAQGQAQRFEPRNPHPLLAQAVSYLALRQRPQAEAAFQAAGRLKARYQTRAGLQTLTEAGFSQAQIQRLAVLGRP